MFSAALTDEEIDCLYGTLRGLLHDQRSGLLKTIAGEAGFALDLIPDGLHNGGTQRAPILSAIDGQWAQWERGRRERTLPRFADALGQRTTLKELNARIVKCGFKFENGGFVPVNAAGEIPA